MIRVPWQYGNITLWAMEQIVGVDGWVIPLRLL